MRLLLPVVVSGVGLPAVLAATLGMAASNQERVAVTSPRSGTVAWMVEDGAAVKEGDALVRLEEDALRSDHSKARLEVSRAQAYVQQEEGRRDMARLDQRQELSSAELALEMAQMDLARIQAGLKLEHRNLTRRLEMAKATVGLHTEQLLILEQQVKQGRADPRELRDVRLVLMQAEAEREQAEGLLQMHEEYEAPMRLRQAEHELTLAAGNLERTQRMVELRGNEAAASLAAAEANLMLSQERLRRIAAQLESSEIRAPQAGTVSRLVAPGATVRERQILVHLIVR